MTDASWPDPERPGVPLHPEQTRRHWLAYLDPEMPPQDFLWDHMNRTWGEKRLAPSVVAGAWHYLGPCLTPAEVAAKVAAEREACAAWHDERARLERQSGSIAGARAEEYAAAAIRARGTT
jgi:hypothetical protein